MLIKSRGIRQKSNAMSVGRNRTVAVVCRDSSENSKVIGITLFFLVHWHRNCRNDSIISAKYLNREKTSHSPIEMLVAMFAWNVVNDVRGESELSPSTHLECLRVLCEMKSCACSAMPYTSVAEWNRRINKIKRDKNRTNVCQLHVKFVIQHAAQQQSKPQNLQQQRVSNPI